MPARSRARLADAPVPLLLPTEGELASTATVTAGPHWAAASMRGDDHTVYVQGARTWFEVPSIELDARGDELARREVLISRTHGIVTLTFERFGVGYHIDVECERPLENELCTKDDYVERLHASLAVALGGAR